MDLFDAMQKGDVDAKFIARDSQRGPHRADQQDEAADQRRDPRRVHRRAAADGAVRRRRHGGGMRRRRRRRSAVRRRRRRRTAAAAVAAAAVAAAAVGGGGGGRRGGFNIPPEKTMRVDVPLLCLDHGMREPSSSKPYVDSADRELHRPTGGDRNRARRTPTAICRPAPRKRPCGISTAASSWDELAAKLTGTERNVVREPYFSAEEMQAAMAIVSEAEQTTAGKKVEPRPFKLPGEKTDEEAASAGDEASPGDAEPAAEEPAAERAAAEEADEAERAKNRRAAEATPA